LTLNSNDAHVRPGCNNAGITAEVREFYDSFSPQNTLSSKLLFYNELKSGFPSLKIPESTAKMTFGCLNPVSRLIDEFKSKNKKFSEPLNILDAGGGAGFDLFLLKQIFPNARVFNIDISHNLLKLGRGEFKDHLGLEVNKDGVYYICAELSQLSAVNNIKFDYIISNAVFNLVADKRNALKNISGLLKEDGSFFLADIAFSGQSGRGPAEINHSIKDGIYYAPTIIPLSKYREIIFEFFGYNRILENKTVKPENIGGINANFSIFCAHIKKNPPAEKEIITCACSNKIELNVFLSVNAEDWPCCIKMIIERRLNSAFCPACKRAYYDFIPYFFEWPQKNIAAHVFPASLKGQKDSLTTRLAMSGTRPADSIFFGYDEFRDFLIKKAATA